MATHHSKLTRDQLHWLKTVIHPDHHRHLSHPGFLTDIMFHTVKTLINMGEQYKDTKICYGSYAGMGCEWYAKRNNINDKIRIIFIGEHDSPKQFYNGYLNLNRRQRFDSAPGHNPYPLI